MQPADQKESEELARVCRDVAERSSKILAEFARKQSQSLSAAVRDEMGIAKAFMDLYARMAADPAAMASFSLNLWLDYTRLWQSSWMKLMGMDATPVAEPDKGDSRFKDEDWSKNFLFDLIKQSYLISSRHIREAVRARRPLHVRLHERHLVDVLQRPAPAQHRGAADSERDEVCGHGRIEYRFAPH